MLRGRSLMVILFSLLLLASLSATLAQPSGKSSITLLPPPTCKAFTKDFTVSLQKNYLQGKIEAVGVRGTYGTYRQAWAQGEFTLTGEENQDHIAYGKCCDICSSDADCVGYTIVPRGWKSVKKSSSNGTTTYFCNIWKTWCLREETSNWYTKSPAGVVFFPASFSKPAASSSRPGPTCQDDSPATVASLCPQMKIIYPDEVGKFDDATADNFEEKGEGAVVRGRYLSLPGKPNAFDRNVTNTTPKECVQATIDAKQFYFTWESCSGTCTIFQNNVCTPFYGNGFSSSTTAFSGQLSEE